MNHATAPAILLTIASLLVTGPLAAQQGAAVWQQQLAPQLELLDQKFLENGYEKTEVRTGLVEAGGDRVVRLDLGPGQYTAAAVCDHDCTDVDLTVEHDGSTLDRDFLEDDVPIVDFSVDRYGSYTFTISMPACSTPTCGYGLGVYRHVGAATFADSDALEDLEVWQQQLVRQLLALDEQLSGEGFVGTAFEFGLVAADQADDVSLSVTAGSYVAAAVCDNDCSDVDLVLYDPAGNTIDEDLLLDDAPVVEFLGPGTFRFQVRMVDCATPTCGWALRVYRKD